MELRYNKLSLLCFSAIFSTTTALASPVPINSSTVNAWANIIVAGNRTFSGVKTLDGVYDPAITGDGNIVTIYSGVQWLSYFIVTDESTGEQSHLIMEFLTN